MLLTTLIQALQMTKTSNGLVMVLVRVFPFKLMSLKGDIFSQLFFPKKIPSFVNSAVSHVLLTTLLQALQMTKISNGLVMVLVRVGVSLLAKYDSIA